MQLITFLSATTAMVATASAKTAVQLGQEYDASIPAARVINRCDYPVHLWSVFKGTGCPSEGMVTLKQGETYSENYQPATDGKTGVSIKISKTEQCKGNDIVQLEYFLEKEKDKEAFHFNYLDVSYVDCLDGDCPTKSEGFYLKAGTQTGAHTASAGNTWCPVLSCHDAISCAKVAYILPDDVQTKTCDLDQSMDFYMCGGEAPSGDYDSAPAPASSSEEAASSTVASSVVAPSSSTVDDSYKIKAAAVTDAPEVKDVEKQSQKTKTQVEVVYVTAYEYVNAKRHAHGHARRHAPFHA